MSIKGKYAEKSSRTKEQQKNWLISLEFYMQKKHQAIEEKNQEDIKFYEDKIESWRIAQKPKGHKESFIESEKYDPKKQADFLK